MKTKLLKIFAVLLMTVAALGSAAQEFSVGDLKYKIYSSSVYCKGLTADAQAQSSLSITIPSVVSYNGTNYRVMGIDAGSFKDETNIKNVYMRFGVAYIESEAFKGCTNIETVRLPSSLIIATPFKAAQNCRMFTMPGSASHMEPFLIRLSRVITT